MSQQPVQTPKLKKAPEKTVVKAQEVVHTYEEGQIIFSQGERGGDLLFIESGSVEIFIQKNNQDVPLAQMGAGEIIGVMTFLTRDKRLASARATEVTKIKKIPSLHIQRFILSFPKWLNIVLKEFVGRINEMNRMYSDAILELKKAKELQITPLFLATQMAQSLAIVGKGLVKNQDGEDIIVIEELNQKMQLVLNQPKEMIDSLMAVFEDSGLLKPDMDLDRKRKIYKMATLDQVAIFTQFVRESSQGTTRKILKARLLHNEILMIRSISKYVMTKGATADKSFTVKAEDLSVELEKITTVHYDAELIEKPAKLGLIVVKGEGNAATITFTPSTILRTLGCVEAMRKLTGQDGGGESIESESQSQASEQEQPAA